jgi:hypothetical protein
MLLVPVYVLFLVLPVFTQYFLLKGQHVPGTFRLSNHHPAEIAHAQVVALVGLGMLLSGFYLPFGRVAASLLPKPTREWPPQAALFVGLVTLVAGWLVFIPGQLGLIPSRLGSGATGTIAAGSYFSISLLTLTWLRHRRREAWLLLCVVIPLSMLVNFFTGSKRMVLTPLFMSALAYVVYERRIRASWLAGGFAILIVLYPLSNFYRMTNPGRGGSEGGRMATFLRNPWQSLAAMSQFTESADAGGYVSAGLASTLRRLDALAVLTVILEDTPARVPFQGGWTIGYIALSYVPRVIWGDKPPMSTGDWVSQTYGSPLDDSTDVGPSWIGELYFNWGYAGVALGMFVMGLLCRVLQEQLFRWNGPIPALFAAVVVLYAVSRSVQGSLMGPVNGTIYNVAPIPIAHYLVGLFTGFQRGGASAPSHRVGPTLSPTTASSAR